MAKKKKPEPEQYETEEVARVAISVDLNPETFQRFQRVCEESNVDIEPTLEALMTAFCDHTEGTA